MGFEDTSSTEMNTETSTVTKQNEKTEEEVSEASEPSNDESGHEEMTIPELLAKTLPESDDEDEDYNPSQETLSDAEDVEEEDDKIDDEELKDLSKDAESLFHFGKRPKSDWSSDTLKVEKILGVTEVFDDRYFHIKWKNLQKVNLVPYKLAMELFPRMVIDFYEERLAAYTANVLSTEE